MLFFGQENTPSFDWETKKYNTELIVLMNKIIEKYPTARATTEFRQFLEILRSENVEETEKVKAYWKKVRNRKQ
ncbi:MAG: hypothetical protein FWH18_05815 [Marinilabiliaceae bacterium]|nr:hypothetical protein [Marinilabiliaceae bacterium]